MAAQLEELRVSFRDDASRGAEAAAAAMNRVGAAGEKAAAAVSETDERFKRAGASAEQLARKYDDAARATAAKEAAERKHARALEDVQRLEQAGGITAQQAAQRRQQIAQQMEVDARRIELAAQRRAEAERRLLYGAGAAGGGATANDNMAASSGRLGQLAGQAGFQIQDFATQVAMGQNAMVAFGTQFAQFAGVFGAGGAIAGAVVTIGVIAAQLLGAKNAAEELNKAIDAQADIYKQTMDAGRAYREGLQDEARDVLRLRDAYVSYSADRRRAEEFRLADRASDLDAQRAALGRRATDAGGLSDLPGALTNAVRLADARRARGQTTDDIGPQLREAASAIIQFRGAGTASAEEMSRLANRLQDAAAIASGSLQPAMLTAARAIRDMIPDAERLERASADNTRQQQALANAAGNTGAQLQGLARDMRALAAININDPLAAIERQIGQTDTLLAALRRGGLPALQAERDTQERARAGEEAYTRVLAEQRQELERIGVAREDIEARAIQAGEAARGREEERIRGVQRLRDEERAAEDARRDAERAAQQAGRNAEQRRRQEEQEAERARREAEQAAERARRDAERETEQNARRLDSAVQRWGDSLADTTFQALEDGARRGADPLASLAAGFGAILRRAASNALSDLVIQPALRSAAGSLGFTGAASGPGSLLGALGLGGVGSGISGFLNRPVGGLGVTYGFERNPITGGELLGGAGLGFGVGSVLGSLVAQSGAQRTNAMLGSGAGAALGVAATLIPGIGPIAPLLAGALGGAGGGLLGGLLGPGSSFSGGDAEIGIDPRTGQLILQGTVGKGFDQGPLAQQASQEIAALNAQLSAAGLRFDPNRASGGYWARDVARIGGGQSGNPRDLASALGSSGALGLLSSSNDNVMRAIGGAGSVQDALAAAQWVTQVYETLAASKDPAQQFAAQLDAVNKQFNDAADTAARYGLETENIRQAQAQAVEDLRLQRESASLSGALAQSRVLGSWLAGQQLAASPMDRLAAAQAQFTTARGNALAAGATGADLGAVTRAADALLSAGSAAYASGPQYQALASMTRDMVRSLGEQLDLPAFSDDITGSLDRWGQRAEDQRQVMTDAIDGMRQELQTLRLLVQQRAA